MVIQGVDYSVARPDPAYLFSKGKRFAVRYLYGTLAGKAVTRSEVDKLHTAGLDVVLNWEWQADEAAGGFNAGVDRGKRALAAVKSLGAPDTAAVYFSVDSDAITTSQAREYFRGIRTVWDRNRVGVYGGRRIVSAAIAESWCRYFWQTFAWSGGVWVQGAHIQQYDNGVYLDGDVDLDRALVAAFGQWKAAEDVALTTEEWDWLRAVGLRLDAFLRGIETVPNDPSGKPYTLKGTANDLVTVKANLQTLLGKDFVDENAIAAAVFNQLAVTPVADIYELLRGLLSAAQLAELKALLPDPV